MTNIAVSRLIKVFSAYHAGETACDEQYFREGLQSYVDRNLPVPFVFLAFPGKSMNELSVSGHLPDLGEELALKNLRALIDAASRVYKPGVHLHIVSEGHCFLRTGCMRPAEEIDAYVSEMNRMKGSDRITLHTIHDFYPEGSIEDKVEAFNREYMPKVEEIRAAIKDDPYYAAIYPARTAFIYHEFTKVLYPDLSANKRQKAAKIIARNFIGHQIAANRLLQDHFGHCVRLSIHQQHNPAAKKYYIDLLPQVEGQGTPWFHVITQEADGVLRIMKKSKAETMPLQQRKGAYPA